MVHLSNRVFALAEEQTVYMDSLLMAKMPGQAGHDGGVNVMAGPDRPSLCPRTFQGDTLVTSDIGWWTSGFYPGVLWQMYSLTGKESFHDLAVKHTLPLAGLLDRETDHDIGFQLMCSFALWEHYDYTHKHEMNVLSAEQIDDILTKGAEKLAARFVPEAGVIRSWNWGAWNIPVIIDNMMNLELLMEYGDREVAEKHALTTARNHFREDGTTFHLVDYADDGTVLGRQTVQGYADDSAWARGQAWALYGYAMMAREEQDPRGRNRIRRPATPNWPGPSTTSRSNWRNGYSPASRTTASRTGISPKATTGTLPPGRSSPPACSTSGETIRTGIRKRNWSRRQNASSAPSPPPNTWPSPAPTAVSS